MDKSWALTILIGLAGGLAVGLQSPLAGTMSARVGATGASLIIHLSGAVISGVLLVVLGGEQIANWRSLPWYMFGAGAFGLALYHVIRYTLPRTGGATMMALIIVGQLLVGVLIDQFGWFGVPVRPITATRLLAIVLLLAGGTLIGR